MAQAHYLAWTYVAHPFITKIWEGRCLATCRIGTFTLPYHDRCAPQVVTGGDDAVFRKDKHRA